MGTDREKLIDLEVRLYEQVPQIQLKEIARQVGLSTKTVRADLKRRLGEKYSPLKGARRPSEMEIARRRRIAARSKTWEEYEARVHRNPNDRRVNPALDGRSYGIKLGG